MGKEVSWTIEKIKKGFEQFYAEYGHYPVATEIDKAPYLPSSRQIQRRIPGGLPELRKQLKLGGQLDYSSGEHSSKRAITINKRAQKVEQEVYTYLCERFGKPFVHREYFFTDDNRNRSDFFVYAKEGEFCVDTFYPKDRTNFLGCINSKMRTYSTYAHEHVPVIFLMMNNEIPGETIESILKNKKNKLPKGQYVMTYAQFKEFCSKRTKIARVYA